MCEGGNGGVGGAQAKKKGSAKLPTMRKGEGEWDSPHRPTLASYVHENKAHVKVSHMLEMRFIFLQE